MKSGWTRAARLPFFLLVLCVAWSLTSCSGDEGGDSGSGDADVAVEVIEVVDVAVEEVTPPPLGICDGDLDCEGVPCLFGVEIGKGVCAKPCGDGCPEGSECHDAMDDSGASYCYPSGADLCQPCREDGDCLSGHSCKDYGEEGLFCASPCQTLGDCPQGYNCDLDGSCRKNTGRCVCNGFGSHLVMGTTCYNENVNGRCDGFRMCRPEGLEDCSAVTPAYEQCNRLDDNCDGQVDEGWCDDDNPCTVDSCDADNDGACINDPAPVEGVACDADSDGCTVDDSCVVGVCTPGAAADCSQLDSACTLGYCDTLEINAFQCLATLYGEETACDDGDPCTLEDLCFDGVCQSGEAKDCGDDNPCTYDVCDTVDGSCTHPPQAGPCDDGVVCTVNDLCVDGLCASGEPYPCDDDNSCTSGSCVVDHGDPLCVYEPIPGADTCDDLDACTLGDHCDAGDCVGDILDCDDEDPCTDDSCDAETGCGYAFNTAACDDDDPCTADDICDGLGGCAGTPKTTDTTCDDVDDDCDGETDENCLLWEALDSGPSARGGASIASDGRGVYLAFGVEPNGTSLGELWRYDTTGGSWTEQAALADGGRFGSACAWAPAAKVLYCYGGMNVDGAMVVYSDLLSFDATQGTWTTVGDLGVALTNHGMVYWDGDLWIFGGASASAVSNKLWKVDLETGLLSQVGLASVTLQGMSLEEIDDTLWILGGQTAVGAGAESSEILTFPLPDGPFAQGGYSPQMFSLSAHARQGSEIFLLGGSSPAALPSDVRVFDVVAGSWSTATSEITLRTGTRMVAVADWIYVFGGDDGTLQNDFHRFKRP